MDFEGSDRAASSTSRTKRAQTASGHGTHSRSVGTVVQHFSQYKVASAPPEHRRITLRCGARAHLSMAYLRSLGWRKPSRACQTERLLGPMNSRLKCSNPILGEDCYYNRRNIGAVPRHCDPQMAGRGCTTGEERCHDHSAVQEEGPGGVR